MTIEMNPILVGVIIFLFLVLIGITWRGGKTRKYEVTLGNDEIIKVSRSWADSLNDEKGMKCYKDEKGNRVWVSDHFTLSKKEVK